jgi:hypothetical protein
VRKLWLLLVLIPALLIATACGTRRAVPAVTPIPTFEREAPAPTPAPILVASAAPQAKAPLPVTANFTGGVLASFQGALFSGSGVCAACHSNMTDTTGQNVSLDADWRASMMGSSTRDPYWKASVRKELEANPALEKEINNACTVCHAPMANTADRASGTAPHLFDTGYLNPANPQHAVAGDGVSCALCHQIADANLGSKASYSGGYVVDEKMPRGQRAIFGPYVVDVPQVSVMQAASGFTPVQGLHTAKAEFCATCHMLYTPVVDAQGQVAGEFPEQMVYLEWKASSTSATQTCQTCHMPVAKGDVQLSSTGGPLRGPFNRHVFTGGNAYMLGLLGTFGQELGVTASSAQLETARQRTVDYLQSQAGSIAVQSAKLEGGTLTTEIEVRNTAGHKFPTSYPSRRAWIHLVVADAQGKVVFESGAVDTRGMILENDNDLDPARFEPHYAEIHSADEVQIYEAIIHTTEGAVTTTLLRAASLVKDNRLLPAGFDKPGAAADIAVRGDAAGDADFTAGGDTVRYVIDLGGGTGPYTLSAELLYQSIGFRWAQNLAAFQGTEIDDFLRYVEGYPNIPVVIASAEAVVK